MGRGSKASHAPARWSARSVTGVIRIEKMQIGGGPGPNRMLMTLKTQMYIGERWELVFVKDALTMRAYASAPLQARILPPRVSLPLALGVLMSCLRASVCSLPRMRERGRCRHHSRRSEWRPASALNEVEITT